MGERYQIHLKVENLKDPKESGYISIHLQFCWGVHIIRNLNRLLTTLNKSIDCHYTRFHEMKEYVNSILTVNKSLEGKYYYYGNSVGEQPYTTFEGDSNHGWCIIFIKILESGKLKIKSKFYDTTGFNKTNEDLWKDCSSEFGEGQTKTNETGSPKWNERDKQKLKKLLDEKLFNNTDEDLQKIYNEEVDEWVKNKVIEKI